MFPLNKTNTYLRPDMAYKRKRSESEESPPSSAAQSSRDPSSSPAPDVSMLDSTSQRPQANPWTNTTASHLDSRTRKRYRDNRPDDRTIHGWASPNFSCIPRSMRLTTSSENTYNMLFAAARSPPQSRKEMAFPATADPVQPLPPQRQHSSLHDYWTIASPPPPIEVSHPDAPASSFSAVCEDCESPIATSNIDTSMDGVDIDVAVDDFACRTCRRRVCDTCAVVEVGAGRDCLQCRTSRKTWVGGIGWVP